MAAKKYNVIVVWSDPEFDHGFADHIVDDEQTEAWYISKTYSRTQAWGFVKACESTARAKGIDLRLIEVSEHHGDTVWSREYH